MNIKVTNLSAKATEKLNAKTCDRLRGVIADHLQDKPWEMERLLWRMTYDATGCMKDLGFAPETTAEEAVRIRAEIFSFYKKTHTEFFYGSKFKAETEAQKALWKALKGDRFAYDTVMSHIEKRSGYSSEEIEKMLRCLNSKKETSQFGGVRQLGFRVEEAVYLKGAAAQMGGVLKEMVDSKKQAINKPAEEKAESDAT